jgi:exodeoxyribonuclease VII large subunit
MAEIVPLNLLELNQKIKSLIKEGLNTYWLQAEISELKVNYSGHCYLEFVQKDESSDRIIARSRAVIWATSYRMIKPYFETTTGKSFGEGIKVMVKASVEFHEVYGLTLIITDIEPTYTVGETALRRQKVLEKLKSEGVIDMNKELPFPILPRRIAVISSKTAAGYGDFMDQLQQNQAGFRFYIKLFPAAMQGNEAESSIIKQLDRIFRWADKFDVVAIIRGGGSQVDLDCFNNYWLAYHLTQFPLPVITGIGHEQDDSVADIVAHTRLKTPTAVAEFLIACMAEAQNNLHDVERQITDLAAEFLQQASIKLRDAGFILQHTAQRQVIKENKQLAMLHSLFISSSKSHLNRNRLKIERTAFLLRHHGKLSISNVSNILIIYFNILKSNLRNTFGHSNQLLEHYAKRADLGNPLQILERGYSLTFLKGKIVKDSEILSAGDEIETIYHKGKSRSTIH